LWRYLPICREWPPSETATYQAFSPRLALTENALLALKNCLTWFTTDKLDLTSPNLGASCFEELNRALAHL